MTEPVRDDDSIAGKLEATRWDYTQSDDRRFLLDPIGRIFGTFCWDGRPRRILPPPPPSTPEDD
jgi:hypothetical protein